MNRAPGRAATRGFTLIEVLLATVLLVGGLTLAFATLRSATAISGRGEAIAGRSERMRAVEGFLRRRLSGAQPMALEIDSRTLQPVRFVGEPQRMQFVADLPDYLGRGGPYVHDLGVSGAGGQQRLAIALVQVQAGKQIADAKPRPPEPLAEGLRQVRFRYRGIDPERGSIGPWQERWERTDQLPLLVSIELSSDDGMVWPPLVVALHQTGSAEAQQ
ncbi:type II secretion system protein J [Xanthomonas theicola]|uniref:General secretion pathway protein GspJ n=1 Tax=Xanthomonas theicola TaxID=56464 RepID=A0A2S6ZKP1_9XANT|nr:type II secretion system protein J [Xanthomonas theicola]PPT92833.1 general secretion pathway protein GspJ [Xanthomonas theicola]QNH25662.1 type II secretion system protein J [Xanthomonas theicola]